jgi:hypothetical protein
MKYILLVLVVFSTIVISCKSKPTGKELMPEMLETDSIELIYFRTPDSVRYFTYLPLTDEEFIREIVEDVTGEVQEENPCSKEGKIYCFRKGQIFNTIFFAYTTEDCSLFRYIKNGNLYHFKMSKDVKEKLAKFKSFAREPQSAAPAE